MVRGMWLPAYEVIGEGCFATLSGSFGFFRAQGTYSAWH